MDSIVTALPPELLAKIFSYLTNQQDVSACRLTSTAFQELSSPFLITRIVFAKRLTALTRLLEVVEHPYFRKHVTELLYDASWYDFNKADNWFHYVEACERAPRQLEDKEWASRKLQDEIALSRIQRTLCLRATSDEDDAFGDDSDERPYQLGCHKSFVDYRQLYQNQTHLNTTEEILQKVFASLPKLKKVLITDWRGLALPGESYDNCAHRLFGNTLAPSQLAGPLHTHENTLGSIISAAREVPDARIELLEVGPHVFESALYPNRGDDFEHDPRDAQYIHLSNILAVARPDLLPFFGGLRRCRLPLYYPTRRAKDFQILDEQIKLTAHRLLSASTSLTHLCLSVDAPSVNSNKYFGTATAKLLDSLIGDHIFPCLRILDLRGWSVYETSLKTFLSAHSGTLRELRLLECLFRPGTDFKALAEWAGDQLSLNGVELNEHSARVVLARKLAQSSTMSSDDRVLNLITDEYESLWLGGRQNMIERELAIKPLESTKEGPWYLQPSEG